MKFTISKRVFSFVFLTCLISANWAMAQEIPVDWSQTPGWNQDMAVAEFMNDQIDQGLQPTVNSFIDWWICWRHCAPIVDAAWRAQCVRDCQNDLAPHVGVVPNFDLLVGTNCVDQNGDGRCDADPDGQMNGSFLPEVEKSAAVDKTSWSTAKVRYW